MAGEVEVIEDIGWVDVVLGTIVEVAVLRISHIAQCYEHCAHSHAIAGVAAHALQERLVLGAVACPRHSGEHEQRQVEDEDSSHGWHKVVEQFHRLTGVGGDEVEEHVDGYHATTEEVEQHYLEGCEEDDKEHTPHLATRLRGQRHKERIERHGQHDVGYASQHGHVLGEAECHVRNGEREHYVYKEETGRGEEG